MIDKRLTAFALLLTGLSAHSASAQLNNLSLVNFTPNLVIPYVLNPCPDGDCGDGKKSSSPVQKKSIASPVRPTIAQEARLNFKSSLSVRKTNLANFVDRVRASDPAGAENLAAMFRASDIVNEIGKGIAPYGLRTNNIADAYTMYWINAWEASRGIANSSETKARAQAVRRQAANALMSTSQVTSASDAQKQEMAEAMLIQAALIGATVQQAKSDPKLMRQLSAAVFQGARALGIDLGVMTLTEEGFVLATKETGGLDDIDVPPAPAALPEAQLGSVSPLTSDAAPALPNYALIAAAGGAGLAGVFLIGKAIGKKG